MRLADLQPGQHCTRAEWATKAPGNGPLIVTRPNADATLTYLHSNSIVSAVARGRQYNDFFLCNESGHPVDSTDRFLSTGYILLSSTGDVTPCVDMDFLETRVRQKLDGSPATKFRIYKLHAVIEPRIQSLQDMLRIVDTEEVVQ